MDEKLYGNYPADLAMTKAEYDEYIKAHGRKPSDDPMQVPVQNIDPESGVAIKPEASAQPDQVEKSTGITRVDDTGAHFDEQVK